MPLPWERNWSNPPDADAGGGGGKPWERNWASPQPERGTIINPADPRKSSGPGILTRLAAAADEGLPDFLGFPVDILNAGMNLGLGALGYKPVEKPFLGSEYIREKMHGLGVGQVSDAYAPQSTLESYAQTFARGVGQAAIPVGGILSKGGRVLAEAAPVTSMGRSAIDNALRESAAAAARNPGLTIAAEIGAGGGQTLGQRVAEEQAPDHPVLAGTIGALVGGVGGGLVGGLGYRRVKNWWADRGLPGNPEVDLPPNEIAGLEDALATLERHGLDANNFSTPDRIIAAAERARAAEARPSPQDMPDYRPFTNAEGKPFGDMNPVEAGAPPPPPGFQIDSVEAMQRGVDAGEIDPAAVPPPPEFPRVLPEGAYLEVTPEGQAITPEQVATGALVGRGRVQAATEDVMARGRGAVGRGQPGDTFSRMIGVESGGRQFDERGRVVRSEVGATGMAQVMPGTGPEAARDAGLPWDPVRFETDPQYNRALGEAYFNKLVRQFGDKRLAVAAYNAGPGRVRRAIARSRADGSSWEQHLPAETQDYLRKVYGGAGGDGRIAQGPQATRIEAALDAGEGIPFERRTGMIGEALDELDLNPEIESVYRAPDNSDRLPNGERAYTFDAAERPMRTTDNIGEFEDLSAPASKTAAEFERRGARSEGTSGDSSRPFKASPNDRPDEAAFFEERADRMTAEAKARQAEELAQEWERRAKAQADQRAREEAGRRRGEQARSQSEAAGDRYSKYGQKPAQDPESGFWRMTPEGFVADANGRPVAFRNAREAAKWATANNMAGDFEPHVWATNSARITLKRRPNSTYGQARPRPETAPEGRMIGDQGEPRETINNAPEARQNAAHPDRAGDNAPPRSAPREEPLAPEPAPLAPEPEPAPRAAEAAPEPTPAPSPEPEGPRVYAAPERPARTDAPAGGTRNRNRTLSEIHAEEQARERAKDYEYRDDGEGGQMPVDKPREAYEERRAIYGDGGQMKGRAGPTFETVLDRELAKDREPQLTREQKKAAEQAREDFRENMGRAAEEARPLDEEIGAAAREYANKPGKSTHWRMETARTFEAGARGEEAKGRSHTDAYRAGQEWRRKNAPRAKVELRTARGAKTTFDIEHTPEGVERARAATDKLPLTRFYSNPVMDPDAWKFLVRGLVDTEKVGELRDALRNIAAKLKGSTALQTVADLFDRARFIGRPFASYLVSADGRLRGLATRFKSATIEELADMFEASAGKAKGTGRTYHEAVNMRGHQFAGRLAELLEPLAKNKASLVRIRDLLSSNGSRSATAQEREIAGQLRKILDEIHEYRLEAGEDLGKVAQYFPRVLDPEAVAKDQIRFIRKATELYRRLGESEPEKMAEDWFRRVLNEHAGIDGSLLDVSRAKAPGTTSGKERVLGPEADKLLSDYYNKDPLDVLVSYALGSVKRAEFTRRFGMKGRVGSKERADWVREHGNKTQLQVLERRIQDEILSSGRDAGDAMDLINSIIEANVGIFGKASPAVRNLVSYAHAWNQLGTMDRATISSLTEMAMGFARSGEIGKGLRFLADAFTEFGRNVLKMDPSDAKRYAESLGLIRSAMLEQTFLSRAGAESATKQGMRKTMAGFYRAIGLHQLTEGQRTAAVKMGVRLLNDMVGDLSSPTVRVRARAQKALAELGVTDVDAFAKYMRDNRGRPTINDIERDVGQASIFNTAISRIVSETVMEPTRGQKPLWASHPVGSLVYGLMSYSYGFKKKVIDRMWNTTLRAFVEKDPAMAKFAAVGIPALLATTYVTDTYLRPYVFGSGYDFQHETEHEAAFRVADRAGLFAGLSPLVNLMFGTKYQRSFTDTFAGSVIGRAGDAANKIASAVKDDSPSNAKERAAAGAFYDVVLEPVIDGLAARYVGGALGTGIILGTGNRAPAKKGQGIEGILPADRNEFMDEAAGVATSGSGSGSLGI